MWKVVSQNIFLRNILMGTLLLTSSLLWHSALTFYCHGPQAPASTSSYYATGSYCATACWLVIVFSKISQFIRFKINCTICHKEMFKNTPTYWKIYGYFKLKSIGKDYSLCFFVFKLKCYLGILSVPYSTLLKLDQINNTNSISY